MLNIFKKEEKKGEQIIAIFMGISGCGKGTQVELFKKYIQDKTGNKTLHIETGAYFREFIKGKKYTQVLSEKIVDSGGSMPASMAVNMWLSHLIENYDGKENVIFDGVARRLAEAQALDDILKFYNLHGYKVIFMNVSKEWATEKLLARGRKDDTKEGVEKRLAWFYKDVMPSIEFFKNNKDCNFIEINGEQTVEAVHKEIIEKVKI